MAEKSDYEPELDSEPTTPQAQRANPKKRVHVMVYEEDWAKLELFYPDSVKRGTVMRGLLRNFVQKIEKKVEERRAQNAGK